LRKKNSKLEKLIRLFCEVFRKFDKKINRQNDLMHFLCHNLSRVAFLIQQIKKVLNEQKKFHFTIEMNKKCFRWIIISFPLIHHNYLTYITLSSA